MWLHLCFAVMFSCNCVFWFIVMFYFCSWHFRASVELTGSVPVWFTVLSAPLPALMTLRENINLTHSAGISTGVVYNSDAAGSTVVLSLTHTGSSCKRRTDAPWCRRFQQFNLHSSHNSLEEHWSNERWYLTSLSTKNFSNYVSQISSCLDFVYAL